MDIADIICAVYLIGINLALLLAMRRDKRAAEAGQARTPEASLLSLGVLGGSLGGIAGMLILRHKTNNPAFALGYPLLLLSHIGIALFLLRSKGAL